MAHLADAHLADAHSTSITPLPTQLHHWMLTLALLVFVGATTARPRHADEVGPSAKRQQRPTTIRNSTDPRMMPSR